MNLTYYFYICIPLYPGAGDIFLIYENADTLHIGRWAKSLAVGQKSYATYRTPETEGSLYVVSLALASTLRCSRDHSYSIRDSMCVCGGGGATVRRDHHSYFYAEKCSCWVPLHKLFQGRGRSSGTLPLWNLKAFAFDIHVRTLSWHWIYHLIQRYFIKQCTS